MKVGFGQRRFRPRFAEVVMAEHPPVEERRVSAADGRRIVTDGVTILEPLVDQRLDVSGVVLGKVSDPRSRTEINGVYSVERDHRWK